MKIDMVLVSFCCISKICASHFEMRSWQNAHLGKRIRCFWSLLPLSSSLGTHGIQWQPSSFSVSQQWQQISFGYVVMQNQLFNNIIMCYTKEIEFINESATSMHIMYQGEKHELLTIQWTHLGLCNFYYDKLLTQDRFSNVMAIILLC